MRNRIVLILLIALMAGNCFDASVFAKKTPSKKAPAKSGASAEVLEPQALKLYLARNYPEALKLFKKCAESDPRETSVQFYMAMCALRTGDFNLAEHALCRVVVMSPSESEFSKISLKTLKDWKPQFHGLQPYSQLEGGELKRWDKHRGPIKVWVSNGLELPKGYNGPELTVEKCKSLYSLIDRPGFIEGLKKTSHYFPDMQEIVEEGIKDWAWVANEGIISFEMTDDPRKADVLFFFCPEWGGGHVGMTFYPWPRMANARCIAVIETEYLRRLGSRSHKELRKTSAHEFGHILGLTVHSNNQDDVMYGNTGRMLTWMESKQYSDTSAVSRNDYVTLRALYELPCDDTYVTMGR